MAVSIRIDLTQRSQNIQGNYSTVNAKVYAISTGGAYAYDNPAGSLTLDGQTYNFNHNFDPNTTTLLFDVDKICYHDSNGDKTVSASSWFNGTGSYTVYANASLTLTHINRQSALDYIGVINDTDTTTLNITKYNNSYTHILNVYKRNGSSADTSVLYATRSGVENGDTFTFTQSELNNLYQQNATNKFVPAMFVLSTYSGNTKIGDSNSQSAITITNANPIFTDFDYEDSNIITTALTGDNSKIVLGYSNLEVTIPVADKATPQKYATMESYIVDDVVVPYSSNTDVTTTINNYNKNSISVWAKDSRYNSTEVNKPLTTIAYTPIVKGNQNIARASSVGTQVNVEFEGTFWNNTFGNTTNDLTVTYRFKKSTDTNWTTGTFIGSVTKSGNNYSYSGGIRGDASDNGFEVDDSYDIELTVSDALSSVLYTYQLIAGNPAIKIKQNKVIEVNGKPLLEKSIMSIYASAGFSAAVTSSYGVTKIAGFDQNTSIGSLLTYNNSAITIGAGVHHILVNAQLSYWHSVSSSQSILMIRRNGTQVAGIAYQSQADQYGTYNVVSSPFLLDVQEGDEIDLAVSFGAPQTIEILQGGISHLTVQVID